MGTYATSATVQREGEIRIGGVPFAPGTEVEITVSPKRKSFEKFGEEWARVCEALRNSAQNLNLSEEAIQEEINDYRAGR